MCVFAQTLSDTWTVAYQAPLFMRFPRQEYLSGLTFPPSRNLPPPRDQTHISYIGRQILTTAPSGKPHLNGFLDL